MTFRNTDIAWLDITVWKQVGTDPASQVHEFDHALELAAEVPDEHQGSPAGYKRTFLLATAHEGAGRLLAKTRDTSIPFACEQLTTFALAYVDEAVPEEEPQPEPQPGTDPEPQPKADPQPDPKTEAPKKAVAGKTTKTGTTTTAPASVAKKQTAAGASTSTPRTGDSANVFVLLAFAGAAAPVLLYRIVGRTRRKS